MIIEIDDRTSVRCSKHPDVCLEASISINFNKILVVVCPRCMVEEFTRGRQHKLPGEKS